MFPTVASQARAAEASRSPNQPLCWNAGAARGRRPSPSVALDFCPTDACRQPRAWAAQLRKLARRPRRSPGPWPNIFRLLGRGGGSWRCDALAAASPRLFASGELQGRAQDRFAPLAERATMARPLLWRPSVAQSFTNRSSCIHRHSPICTITYRPRLGPRGPTCNTVCIVP